MNKKIYFAGSIRGGREDAATYQRIINYIKRTDVVLTEHIGNNDLGVKLEAKERPSSFQEVLFCTAKDALLECKRASFKFQETVLPFLLYVPQRMEEK